MGKKLTKRQEEIARLVGRGMCNQEIATRLHVAEETVKSHMTQIYKRLGITGRPKLVRWAIFTFEMNYDV